MWHHYCVVQMSSFFLVWFGRWLMMRGSLCTPCCQCCGCLASLLQLELEVASYLILDPLPSFLGSPSALGFGSGQGKDSDEKEASVHMSNNTRMWIVTLKVSLSHSAVQNTTCHGSMRCPPAFRGINQAGIDGLRSGCV